METGRMSSRSATSLALGCAAALFVCFLFARPESRPQNLLRDFNAFYCAGRTIALHLDPYLNEPLGTCERSVKDPVFLAHAPANLTIPAPLPGYALAPFAFLAFFPYGIAGCVWIGVILVSFALTVFLLHKLLSLPLFVIIAALILSDAYIGITLGQIVPVAIAAVVSAAYALTWGRVWLAACFGAAAMIEPHIGLPACIALTIFSRRTIAPLALCCILLATLSVALIGVQALSESGNVKQLSLTTILAQCGVTASLAVRIGALWYIGMLILGLFVARRIAGDTQRPAAFVLFPVAFSMIGGSFVHIAQIAAVVPAALFLLDLRRNVSDKHMGIEEGAIIAVMLLAVPWPQFASLGTSFPILAAVTVGVLAFALAPKQPLWRTVPPFLAIAWALFPSLLQEPIADPATALSVAYDPHALAQTSWSTYVALVGTHDRNAYDVARLPTLCGLIAFLRSGLWGR
jgi:hypothetical protein